MTTETPYFYTADLKRLLPDVAPDSIVSRTIYGDGQFKAVLFGFAPGTELSEHTSSQAALLHIVEGEAALTLGDDALEAKAGTWVRMPPRLRHSVVAKTPVVMLLLMLAPAS